MTDIIELLRFMRIQWESAAQDMGKPSAMDLELNPVMVLEDIIDLLDIHDQTDYILGQKLREELEHAIQ